ncbi:MFS transporter [Haloarcula sp. GH36]|uniref:MFS transporter n=1 Tax=Haloarcula montana TaxID=3111776 RepID=UPI002D7A31C4|nr:MFS transporter [Haloarcula sp. GH36]
MDDTPSLRRSTHQGSIIGVSALLWSIPTNLATTTLAVFVGQQGTAFQVSLVTMSHFFALLLFAPAWGVIADITGKHREILVGAGIVGSAMLFVLGFTDGVWSPILLRGLYAVFFAAFPPLMLTVVSERDETQGRGRALGIFNSWRSVGFALGQFFAGLSLTLLAYLEIYVILGVVNLAATAVTWFVSNPVPARDGKLRLDLLWSKFVTRLYPARGDRSHLTTHGLHWMYVAVCLQGLTFFGLLSLLPVYLTGEVGISETLMGAFLGFNPLSRIVLMIVFGAAVERIGRKPVLGMGLAGTGLFALVLTTATVPDSPLTRKLVVGIGFAVIAVSFSATIIGSQTFIGDVAALDRESELMGFRSTASGVGGVLGPLLVGGLVTLLNYDLAFMIVSSFSFAGAVLVAVGVSETATNLRVVSHE